MKILIKSFIVLSVIVLCVFLSLFYVLNSPTDTISPDGVDFEIKRGDSLISVSIRMHSNGYIRSLLFAKVLAKTVYRSKSLQPGWVKLFSNQTTMQHINRLYSKDFITVTFTIPEGYKLDEVKDVLKRENILTEQEISDFFNKDDYLNSAGLGDFETIDSLEGFLFPDTYKFYKGSSAEEIFRGMVNLFIKKVSKIYPDYRRLSSERLKEIVTMASIIEKEVRVHDESSVVAGVFYNRIKRGEKLQSCATVQYILDKPKERLLESDLLVDNPYNTYLNKGLPPGPICNPGERALEAAFYPEEHNYLFFVVKDPVKGTHHFSKDYNEHLLAQKRYLSIQGFR